jgi:hypothetical protein
MAHCAQGRSDAIERADKCDLTATDRRSAQAIFLAVDRPLMAEEQIRRCEAP